MPPIQFLLISDLIRHLRRPFILPQKSSATKVGIRYKTVNQWKKVRSLSSLVALHLIQDLLEPMGEPGQALLRQYFLEGERDV